ncbi:MAG: SusC/RagA family TonB-linked outer membrane protein [Odoribacter sp.]
MQKKVCFRIGKIKFFILAFLLCLMVDDLYAEGDDQYENMKISLKVNNENLDKVLDKIADIAQVHFFYNHTQLNINKKVTLDLKERPLRDVLEWVLGDQNVTMEFQLNRTIILKPQPKKNLNSPVKKISGQVIDAKTKEVLPGASIVMAEQRGMGVVTDMSGRVFIEVPEGISALLVSFIGYEEEAVKLQGELSDLVIKLSPRIVEMESVVVTGMTPRKVESFTGGYVTVKGEELKKLSPNNLLKALQLFDPSFRIVENNSRGSDPNTLPEFQLRGDVQIGAVGSSSVNMLVGDYSNRPNMPLFILDGFECTLQRIVDLDPERVESITILKDAAATAIYGSRAATGVVVFETKKPLPGALNVSYSANIGVTLPDLTDYNMMNAEEKLQYEEDAGLFDVNSAEQMNYYNHYRQEILRGVNTYWLSEPLRTAVTHRHSLSIDGGDEALRYSLSLNYGSTPGVMKKSDRTNLGFGINLQYRRKKWNIGNSLNISNTKGNNTPYGSFSTYTKLNPYYRKTDENGNYTNIIEHKFMGVGTSKVLISNPLYNTQFPHKDFTENFSIVDNLSIECAILENLRLTGEVSLNKGTAKGEVFKSMNHTDFAGVADLTKKGSYAKNIGSSFSWSTNASINYNFTKGDHLLSVFGRWNVEETKNDATSLSAKGFPNDKMSDFLFAYEMDNRVSGSESTSRSMGVVGQVSYMYDFRYSVDFNIRGDLSSSFGENTKMAPFWSVGARWNVSKEKWLENTLVSNLVLLGSYGITGSQNYSPYQSVETYNFDDLMFPYISSDVLGAELMGLGNPDLGWSKTKAKSVTLELGLWNNRFNFSANYYNNYTNQLLLDYTIAPSAGFPTITTNAGAIENSGVDVSMSVMPIQDYKNQIQWNISVNGAYNRNVVKKISNLVKKMNEDNMKTEGAPLPIYEEGKSTTQLFAVQSLGIDPATGKEVFLKRNGQKTFIWDPADKIPMGDTQPKLRGAVSTSLTYKNFTFALGCSYELGSYRYNQTLVDKIENASVGYNMDRRAAENRWRKPGDITKYKSMELLGQGTQTSSRFVQKFNEFKFNSISAGYRLDPKNFKFLQSCRIANLSVNATMEDIARISTVKQERGLDYPFARSFSVSLSVLFN